MGLVLWDCLKLWCPKMPKNPRFIIIFHIETAWRGGRPPWPSQIFLGGGRGMHRDIYQPAVWTLFFVAYPRLEVDGFLQRCPKFDRGNIVLVTLKTKTQILIFSENTTFLYDSVGGKKHGNFRLDLAFWSKSKPCMEHVVFRVRDKGLKRRRPSWALIGDHVWVCDAKLKKRYMKRRCLQQWSTLLLPSVGNHELKKNSETTSFQQTSLEIRDCE